MSLEIRWNSQIASASAVMDLRTGRRKKKIRLQAKEKTVTTRRAAPELLRKQETGCQNISGKPKNKKHTQKTAAEKNNKSVAPKIKLIFEFVSVFRLVVSCSTAPGPRKTQKKTKKKPTKTQKGLACFCYASCTSVGGRIFATT